MYFLLPLLAAVLQCNLAHYSLAPRPFCPITPRLVRIVPQIHSNDSRLAPSTLARAWFLGNRNTLECPQWSHYHITGSLWRVEKYPWHLSNIVHLRELCQTTSGSSRFCVVSPLSCSTLSFRLSRETSQYPYREVLLHPTEDFPWSHSSQLGTG